MSSREPSRGFELDLKTSRPVLHDSKGQLAASKATAVHQ